MQTIHLPVTHWVRDYFVFAKWQRRAISLLLVISLALFFAPLVYGYFFSSKTVVASEEVLGYLAELKVRPVTAPMAMEAGSTFTDLAPYQKGRERQPETASGRLFAFNPNTATAATWRQLGLRDKTIQTIEKYLAKGGRFRQPSDIQKIYGLSATEAERLIPYVRIEAETNPSFEKSTLTPALNRDLAYHSGKKTFSRIDINQADTSAFIALPGIGSKLAARIVNFREKLGGFYSVDQVGETYGVPDSTFQKIKPYLFVSENGLRQIGINHATAEQLRIPYIKYQVANAIVQYRAQHGPFKSLEELKKIMLIDEATYAKMAPYLKVD